MKHNVIIKNKITKERKSLLHIEFLSEWLKFNNIFTLFFQIENTYFWLESDGVYVLVGGRITNAMTLSFFDDDENH